MSNYTDDSIIDLSIVTADDKTIFESDKYLIPRYQRAFAWTETEIVQLINDIKDCESDNDYYLGSLIVNLRDDNRFEVIDGQQRLTALFLLLNVLNERLEDNKKFKLSSENLSYECRKKSEDTLKHLQDVIKGKTKNNTKEIEFENSMLNGVDYITKKLNSIFNHKDNADKYVSPQEFKEKLKRIKLFRITVPYKTDRNRYFETMNTRGEQLEHTDVLKAQLMDNLKTDNPNNDSMRHKFATIWDACRNMSGYVQMKFTNDREILFGDKWDKWDKSKEKNYELLCSINTKNSSDSGSNDNALSILQIIKLKDQPKEKAFKDDKYEDEDEKNERNVTFNSIVDFQYFLTHVLRAFVITKGITNAEYLDAEKFANTLSFDEKKFLANFKTVQKAFCEQQPKDKKAFSCEFIIYLLKCRYLFDKYIIKRRNGEEGDNAGDESDDGSWSLKKLNVSESGGNKKSYVANTITKETKDNQLQEKILMLQACLRVSYNSPKAMHWITKLLSWLVDDNKFDDDRNLKNPNEYATQIEKILVAAVNDEFFEAYKENKKYKTLGVETPRVVFNYLDYLLWKDKKFLDYLSHNDRKKYENHKFEFKFRNSVEHWYPQNPSDNFANWGREDENNSVDRFGNLCLLPRGINSKFSNSAPSGKAGNTDKIKNGSLKLIIMSGYTRSPEDNDRWKDPKDGLCAKHEEAMLQILQDACKNKK